jgi:hypothetical protein
MKLAFPTIVYRTPGAHHCPGGTYDFLGVEDEVAFDEAVKDGWYPTMPEALAKELAPQSLQSVIDQLEVLGDDEPPTRAELERQATELGIKFKKTTTDEELNLKINEALEG